MRNGADNEAPARRASPSNQLVNAANTRADVMHELHAELRSGQITLPQAFRELGLGFDPKVSEEAAAFAVDSIDAFADLFNACVDMQETRAARASSPKNSRASPSMPGTLNAEGARLVTMYAGAEPDSIDHAAFSGVPGAAAELEVGALSLMRPASGLSGRDESPSMRDPKRERRRSREIDGLELSTELSPGNSRSPSPNKPSDKRERERRRSRLHIEEMGPPIDERGESQPPTPASLRPPEKGAEPAAAVAAAQDESAGGGGSDALQERLQELSQLRESGQARRHRRATSSQLATSLSKEMHTQAVLPTELVGTYSCHGIDSNQDKINQDAACICYPLKGDPHSALLIVVDGHGELGHDVTDEVIKQLVARTEQHSWGGAAEDGAVAAQLTAAFEDTQASLHDHYLPGGRTPICPAERSGACALLMVLRDARLSVAHTGDCRAVLGTFVDGKLLAEALTVDHSPGEPNEAARLQAFGAYVQRGKEKETDGYFEPARLYRRDASRPSGRGSGPGLAMSRSLGDFDGTDAGVIATPTVSHRAVVEDDAFVVMASDGIWEMLTSEFVVSAVGGFLAQGQPATAAARFLIAKAAVEWKLEEGTYRDDITAVVVYLKDLLPIL